MKYVYLLRYIYLSLSKVDCCEPRHCHAHLSVDIDSKASDTYLVISQVIHPVFLLSNISLHDFKHHLRTCRAVRQYSYDHDLECITRSSVPSNFVWCMCAGLLACALHSLIFIMCGNPPGFSNGLDKDKDLIFESFNAKPR